MYRELEAQILENLREGDREQFLYLLGEHDLAIELLSGEWRALFRAAEEFYQVTQADKYKARMAVSPDELAEFVQLLRENAERWEPISFGLAELQDALPADCDLAGVVFIEESDDWLWNHPVYEMVAIRPEVYELIQPDMEKLLAAGDHASLARLAGDHSEGSVEFGDKQWQTLLDMARERVPELLAVVDGRLSSSEDYTQIREALSLIADPQFQPSLDAWLRVHAEGAQYVLYFRHAGLERASAQDSQAAAKLLPGADRTGTDHGGAEASADTARPEGASTPASSEPSRTAERTPAG